MKQDETVGFAGRDPVSINNLRKPVKSADNVLKQILIEMTES